MPNRYALIKKNTIQVCNVILADEDFESDGYYLNKISNSIFCEIGMFFNSDDGLYYQDETFKKIYPETQTESS